MREKVPRTQRVVPGSQTSRWETDDDLHCRFIKIIISPLLYEMSEFVDQCAGLSGIRGCAAVNSRVRSSGGRQQDALQLNVQPEVEIMKSQVQPQALSALIKQQAWPLINIKDDLSFCDPDVTYKASLLSSTEVIIFWQNVLLPRLRRFVGLLVSLFVCWFLRWFVGFSFSFSVCLLVTWLVCCHSGQIWRIEIQPWLTGCLWLVSSHS